MTVTFATDEINDFWDKIYDPQILAVQDLVSEVIYLKPNSRYTPRTEVRLAVFGLKCFKSKKKFVTFATDEINDFWDKI